MVKMPWRRCAQVLALSAFCSHAIASRTEDSGKDYFNEPTEDPDTFYPDLHPCPRSCDDKSPKGWDVFTSYDRLKLCAQPMLFDLSLYNDIDDNDTPTMLRICTTGNAHTRINALFSDKETPTLEEMPIHPPKMFNRRVPESPCLAGNQTNLNLDLTRSGSEEGNLDHVSTVLGQFSDHFDDKSNCHNQILFGFSNGTVAGLYVGASFGKATVKSLVSSLLKSAMTDGHSSTMVGQVCGSGRNARHVLGLAVSTTGDIGAVQKMVRGWNGAVCHQSTVAGHTSVPIQAWEASDRFQGNVTLQMNSTRSLLTRLVTRGDCRTEAVQGGDGCDTLASRCGISGADFTKYNSDKDTCSTLSAGQRVCCSPGNLPDIRPKPNADGSCHSVYVNMDDDCSKIANMHGLKVKDLEEFNQGHDGTWGWTGCDPLMAGINICVSKGRPPMPAPVANAVCGPTKPGSKPPAQGKSLSDLNPCPLNACCNIWGQCGISGDFCTEKRGQTDNPGTAPKKVHGCISNCGMEIVKGENPGAFGRIGYYESWNFKRDCLYMRASHANTDGSYTIIHWAFVEIDASNWSVKVKDDYNQWDDFKRLQGVKKVISFGGWAFSNEPGTYDMLRQAMSPAHRSDFVANIGSFLNEHKLDGVDFDWEYPGATDIDGTPPGFATDGPNYLKFLTLLRNGLARGPHGKTISIAAPASFWYLKNFPIKQMAQTLDYIVYMTYDLHGQWDAGNQWSIDGCPAGNCLRSHINLTETTTALAMITKAGVPSWKIYVGESSYGRSFKMSKAGCDGPMCTFEGDRYNSEAAPGICTGTPGYISNAEIERIRTLRGDVKSWHDGASNSDMMVYDDTEWVAYMTPVTKGTRRTHWQGFNFAGTIDWAVDLQAFTADEHVKESDNELTGDSLRPSKCDGTYDTLDAIEKDTSKIEPHCRDEYVLKVLGKMLQDSLKDYDEIVSKNYDHHFDRYSSAVVEGAPGAVASFMYEKGNTYFTCVVTETVDSCNHCNKKTWNNEESKKRACRYCEDYDCGWVSSCPPNRVCSAHHNRYTNYSMPCPPDYSMRSHSVPKDATSTTEANYWTLRGDMSGAFYRDLLNDTGITESSLVWRNVKHGECADFKGTSCPHQDWDYNFPMPDNYKQSDVGNPKDLVQKARKNMDELAPGLTSTLDKIQKGTFNGIVGDLVDALSVPIIMVENAVANMKTVDKIGADLDKQDEEKKKMLIVAFLSAILFFVPFVGELAGAVAALAGVGRLLSVIGAIGSVGMDIYSVVDSKGNDPFAIAGLVLAPLAIADVARISKAANIRRGMAESEVQKLGPEPKGKLDIIERIKGRKVCEVKKRALEATSPVFGGQPMSGLNGELVLNGFTF